MAAQAAQEHGGNGYDAYAVRAKMAMLHNQWATAETLMLNQGRIDDTIAMYKDAYKCVGLGGGFSGVGVGGGWQYGCQGTLMLNQGRIDDTIAMYRKLSCVGLGGGLGGLGCGGVWQYGCSVQKRGLGGG